jgi:hypothetical protein
MFNCVWVISYLVWKFITGISDAERAGNFYIETL